MAFVVRSRKGGFLRGGVRRRETHWIAANAFDVSANAGAGGAALLTSLSAVGLALLPFTIVRNCPRKLNPFETESDSRTDMTC